jgi:hypothetical protein
MAKGKISTKQAIKQTLKKKKKKPAPQPPEIISKSEESQETVDVSNENRYKRFDLNGKMTDKESRFIYFYMAGGITVEQSMILAGYKGYSATYLYQLGKMIVNKHECQTDDHRKIFRAVGAGETAIAQGLLHLAQNANSEMVRLNAWTALAKCLGLTKEVLEGVEGIQIVINSSRGLPGKPAAQEPGKALPPSSGALTVTR